MTTALSVEPQPVTPAPVTRRSLSPACRRSDHEWCEMGLQEPYCVCSCHDQPGVYPAA